MNYNHTFHSAGPGISDENFNDYYAPELFKLGRAAALLQGPMITSGYKDTSNDYYSNWPTQ